MVVFNLLAIPVAAVAFGLAFLLAGPLGIEDQDMLIGPALVAADILLRIVLGGFRASGLWTPKAGGTIFWLVPLYVVGLLISWGSMPTMGAASVTATVAAVAVVLFAAGAKEPPAREFDLPADDHPEEDERTF